MKVMSVRDFLRGGYQDLTEMTLITNHGRPVGTWMPQTDGSARRAVQPEVQAEKSSRVKRSA